MKVNLPTATLRRESAPASRARRIAPRAIIREVNGRLCALWPLDAAQSPARLSRSTYPCEAPNLLLQTFSEPIMASGPTYTHLTPPTDGETIVMRDGRLVVPDHPIIPYIEG